MKSDKTLLLALSLPLVGAVCLNGSASGSGFSDTMA